MKYFDLLSEIHHFGETVVTRNLETKELLNVVLDVDDYNCFSVEDCRPWEEIKKYLYAELAWYMSGDRDITKILPYSKFWESIRNPDNTANSNYGDLVFYRRNSHGFTSFDWALQVLADDKHTRKALVLYNDKEFFSHGNRDLICNQYQHFFIRYNMLLCTVALRSSDAIYGLTYNIPWWSFVHQRLHRLLVEECYSDLKLGPITAFISSSHIYENKYSLVDKMVNSRLKQYKFLNMHAHIPLGLTFEEYMLMIPGLYNDIPQE